MAAMQPPEPPHTWTMRHPLAYASWLEVANRLRRWYANKRLTRTWLVAAAILGTLSAAIPLVVRFWPVVLHAVGPHLTTAGILVALQASVLVHRGRRKWTAIYASNWLSTLPVARRAYVRMIALRSFIGPLLFLLLLTFVALLADVTAPGSQGSTLPLLASCGAATMVGALLGWWLPQRAPEDSHSVSIYAHTSGPSTVAKLAGLSRWPAAQTKTWLQPRTTARLLLPAVLLLPMDVSGNVAIAVLGVWTLAIYLFVLLRATVHVAREGARWLRPTPLTFNSFAWAVAQHPLLKQLQWTLVAAGLLVALGCKPLVAVRAAEWWLALVSVTSGIALAHAYQARAMSLKLVVSVCALAILERFRQHLALPCAVLISAWQFRKAART